jgi:hypothetical protein
MYNISLHQISKDQPLQAQLIEKADGDRVTIGEILINGSIVGRARIVIGPDHVFLDKINNFSRDKIKGIGTILLQWVIETSIHQNLNGRVKLQASLNSHIFHYKMGFRPETYAEIQPGKIVALDLFRKYQRGEDISQNKEFLQYSKHQVDNGTPQKEVTIEKCLGCFEVVKEIQCEINRTKKDGCQPNTKYLGQVDMYLTDTAIEEWKDKIFQNPLLKTSSE